MHPHRASALGWPLALGLLVLSADPCLASWASDGNRVVGAASVPTAVTLLTAPAGDVHIAWLDARTGYNTDVRASVWTTRGTAAPGWALDGNLVTAVTCRKYELAASGDGLGGALYAWSDNRCNGFQQVYARRVAASGVGDAGWPPNGVLLAPTTTNQVSPAISPDGAGGAFVAWQDLRGGDADIYLQHVDASGTRVAGWPALGLAIASGAGAQTSPVVSADGGGGVFVAWLEPGAGGNNIEVQHIGADGACVAGWPISGVPACTAPGDRRAQLATSDDAGGVFLAWQDARAGNWDVYATRIQGDGALASGWTANGTPVCAAAGDQTAARIAPDGSHGLLLAWQDRRGADQDVYAIRMDTGGTVSPGWTSDGVPLCAVAGDQGAPDIAADGAGGAYVVWQDQRASDTDIRGSHVAADASLAPGWPESGAVVCAASGEQTSPRIAASAGEAYVAWLDRRANPAADELYAQRLAATGPVEERPSALTAVHHDGQTFLTWTSPPDTGWTYRIYCSASALAADPDLAGATLLGSVGDSSAVDHRFYVITGTLATFRVDSSAVALPVDRGLFVVTVPEARQAFYAVTSQPGGGLEDRHIVPGANSLAAPVAESVAPPRPVFQRVFTFGAYHSDIYTLWTWDQDVPGFPAMSNRPGWPYDCGVTHGAPQGPAFVRVHQRGGNFLGSLLITGDPAEWVLGPDDYTLNGDMQTYWYGYHPSYDFLSDANVPPLAGSVIDYTNRRVAYTIEWWRRTFDFDTNRHYAFGYSLGGTYALQLALMRPDLIVAAMSSVAKVDYSFESDLEGSLFNPGTASRQSLSNLWGTTATNLPSTEGRPVYAVMNDGALASASGRNASFILNIAGRHDLIAGWAEKLPFYAAMEAAHLGGMQFWDSRDHSAIDWPGAMGPMLDPRYLYRFRGNRSWPAFSRCSADGVPGDGTLATGDSLGTLNGYMEWDPQVTDTPFKWVVDLSTRSLTTRWWPLPAPGALTVDVTPRRTQQFRPSPGMVVQWGTQFTPDGPFVQRDSVVVDTLGLVTIPAVGVQHVGTRLTMWIDGDVAGVPSHPAKPALALAPFANPARGSLLLRGSWPHAGEARVLLFDTNGRVVSEIWHGEASAGEWQRPLELSSRAAGLYWVRAEQRGEAVVRRLVLLH